MKRDIFMILGTFLIIVGCISESDEKGGGDDNAPAQYIRVLMTVDKQPDYMGTATVTLKYYIDFPPDKSDTLTINANGWFRTGTRGNVFSIVSGDSSWTDTVQSFTEIEHQIVIKAHKRGGWVISGYVTGLIDTFSALGGTDIINIYVR